MESLAAAPHLYGSAAANATGPLDPCLADRKWWAFLLSSIFTFIVGIFIILIFRAIAFVCSSGTPSGGTTQSQAHQLTATANGQKKPLPVVTGPVAVAPQPGGAKPLPPGTQPGEQPMQQELGWMTEASGLLCLVSRLIM